MGKSALVTGGAGGIGSAICRELARDGWFVNILYGSSKQRAERLAAELGGRALQADLTKPEELTEAFTRLGGVELLVNNAGIAHYGLLSDMRFEEWRRLFAVNVDGAFLCTKLALPHMIHEKKGCIINISSMWGQVGASCEAAYSASKAALIGLTKALAKELGPSGIRVNCVAPGVIRTDMLAGFSEAELEELRQETPLERLGEPEDVAGLTAFLASERASFITGQVIGCSGGFVID